MISISFRQIGAVIIPAIFCLAAVTGIPAARAADYYVNITSGTDSSGGGSAAAPWKTLHYAVPRLTSSDILHVASGFYTIANGETDGPIEITAGNVTIQADGPGVVIEGDGAAYWVEGLTVSGAANVRITGLNFLNFANAAASFQHLTGMCILSDCTLKGNATGIQVTNSSPVITRNRLFDNGYSIYIIADSPTGPASPEISNNLIASRAGGMQYGIKIEATVTDAVASPLIYHNTIDGASADGMYIYNGLGATAEAVTPDIRFNIVTNCSQFGINNIEGTPSQFDYNDVWNNSGGNYTGITAGTSDISDNPLYLPHGDQYYLQSTSPCINRIPIAGHPVSADLRGKARPQGSLIDLGCFEIVEPFILPGVYYVDVVNGRNEPSAGTAPGTGAFRNLHFALDRINYGDPGAFTLEVAPGIYGIAGGEEDAGLEVITGSLIIKGTPSLGAVVDGSGALQWTSGMTLKTSGIGISGLRFQHFSRAGITVDNCGPSIHHNDFLNNHTGILVDSYSAESAPSVINNLLRGDTASGMNNGIVLYAAGSSASAGGSIYFNTINGGAGSGIFIGNNGGSAAPEIKYNIISNFGKYGIQNTNGGPILSYNNLFNNLAADYLDVPPGEMDISASPAFISATDFHLQVGSACIDRIPADSVFPSDLLSVIGYDLDGNPRPMPSGGSYDLGAYEQAGSALTIGLAVYPEGAGSVVDNLSQIDCPGDCTGSYSSSDTIILQATANAGFRFDHWEIGAEFHTENPVSFTPHASQTGKAVFAALTNQPPIAPAGISPRDGASFDGATTQVALLSSVYADPENDGHANTHWLVRRQDRGVYYCDDYDVSFTRTASAEPELTSHEVSGLESGMQYVWKVGYQDTGSGQIAWSPEYVFTIGDPSVDREVNSPGGALPQDYRMVSFPVWPSHADCSTAFRDSFPDGLYDPRTIRLGIYDPLQSRYLECPDNLVVTPGKAYWLISREGLDMTLHGIPATLTLDMEIPLSYAEETRDGWNMVACPNFAAYEWSRLEILESDGAGGVLYGPAAIETLGSDNAYIDIRLWSWENGAYASTTTQLRPHQGYWVKARKANLYLKFPASARLSPTDVSAASMAPVGNTNQPSRKAVQENNDNEEDDDDDSPPPPMESGFYFKSDGLAAAGSCFIGALNGNRD
ncbi:MAG: right-handed parallel beta-helix repeat-containing protein [Thermodesulfobacteriota bacterium]